MTQVDMVEVTRMLGKSRKEKIAGNLSFWVLLGKLKLRPIIYPEILATIKFGDLHKIRL